MSNFSANLKSLRIKRNLTQHAIAQKIDVSQQGVSEWEKGKIEPCLSSLVRMADFFEISLDELVGRV